MPSAMRGALVTAAGVLFMIAAVGVPLPARRAKDVRIPFPCMDRPCGCHDAADCKAHCCCFSGEEKLAWAAEHGINPTPFVDDAALARVQGSGFRVQRTPRAPGSGHADGCQKAAVAACCSQEVVQDAGDEVLIDEVLPARTSSRQHGGKSSPGLVTIAAYRQCKGLQSLWTLLGAALPPPERVRCEFDFLLIGRVAEPSPAFMTVSFSPATPPPRA